MKKKYVDWKGRPYILGTNMAFLEQDGNAEIYMDWEDLDCLTENEIDSIKSNYPQSAHRYIFHRLFLAERSNSYLKAGPEQQTRIKERASGAK